MPTFDRLALFKREYRKLTPEQKARFRVAVAKLIAALSDTPPGLPGDPLVHPLTGHHGVYELRFAPDGRATFTFGAPVRNGKPHIIWRRIGGHDAGPARPAAVPRARSRAQLAHAVGHDRLIWALRRISGSRRGPTAAGLPWP